MTSITYTFESHERCPMCSEPTESSKKLGQRLNRRQGVSPRRVSGISISVHACRGCNLHFPVPVPYPKSLSQHYGDEPTEYWKSHQIEVDENDFKEATEKAKRLIDFEPGMKALDIGSGTGKCMAALKRNGFEVFGVEPMSGARSLSIQRFGFSPEAIRGAPIEQVEFPDSMFNFITFGAVLEHLYEPGLVLERALAWLKPKGVIHVEVPNSRYLIQRMINSYYRLVGTNFVTNLSPMHNPFHIYEFSVESFRKHGSRVGYEIAEHQIHVCEIQDLPRFSHKFLRSLMSRTDTGAQLEVWLRKT